MFEKIKGAIKNEQTRDTSNTGYKTQDGDKQNKKYNTDKTKTTDPPKSEPSYW